MFSLFVAIFLPPLAAEIGFFLDLSLVLEFGLTARLLLTLFYYNTECARLSGKLFVSCVLISVLLCSSLVASVDAASM